MNIREKTYKVIFETDTKAGKNFDVALLYLILCSVMLVMFDSVPEYSKRFGQIFISLEWGLTIIFSIEYILRIWSSKKPLKYIFSPWGIIDLLSIIPTYLSLLMTGYHYLLVVRIFRLLRVFRILKLARFTEESAILMKALKASSYKISIFLFAVVAIVVMLGTLMYVIEGGEQGFTSIPQSIYWAIVTITTVGYGDMVPQTLVGKFISSVAMIIGYAIIAVPTGIVTVEMSKSAQKKFKECETCKDQVDISNQYCPHCGTKQNRSEEIS